MRHDSRHDGWGGEDSGRQVHVVQVFRMAGDCDARQAVLSCLDLALARCKRVFKDGRVEEVWGYRSLREVVEGESEVWLGSYMCDGCRFR